MTFNNITESNTWKKLLHLAKNKPSTTISVLFSKSPQRKQKFTLKTPFGLFDFSKNNITKEALNLLDDLFTESVLDPTIEAQFSGEKINNTEGRAVLHTALRNFSEKKIFFNNIDISADIDNERHKMKTFSDKIRSGKCLGCSKKPITDIVNIGIGGSDLGPKMAYEALRPFKKENLNVHFVSNVDGTDLTETLKNLNPETTLFIVASKTFTTQETMANAHSARNWFLAVADEKHIAKHFVAVSTNKKLVREFGIDPQNIFTLWDWVGGRFSVWSSIGLSLCIAIGYQKFEEFLRGASWMDEHFKTEPLERNIPKMMAAVGIWHRNFLNYNTTAVLPYDEYLNLFPGFLQQADMESNGKSVDKNGNAVQLKTGPVVWGKSGTNGQHAFYQLIHQGTEIIPADFIGFCKTQNPLANHHNKLMANFFAQPEALMNGKNEEEVKAELKSAGLTPDEINKLTPFKVFEGNRPSNSFLLNELNPFTLGALIAAYEHKIFVQGVVWNINSFDQWGVELGKQLAGTILPELENTEKITCHDPSTNGLINYYNELRG